MSYAKLSKKQQILSYIRDNPFITQQDLANELGISRSAVATYISLLTQEGEIVGRAYVLPAKGRITCVGGANVDRKIQSIGTLEYGTSNPATVAETHGGVARNIAENLARFGHAPALLTMVGHDAAGQALLDHCAQVGVDVSYVMRTDLHRTGTYTAILDHLGDMAVALADMQIYDAFRVDRLQHRRHVLAVSSMVVADTNLPAESLQYLLQLAQAERVRLCIAPVSSPKARRLPQNLAGVSLLVANVDEAGALVEQQLVTLADLEGACAALIARGCQAVVITRGKAGVVWMNKDHEFAAIPAPPVNVIDVTGAGDAFVAGVVYALQEGYNVANACHVGLLAAQVTLTTKETVATAIQPDMARAWLAGLDASSAREQADNMDEGN